MRLSAGGEWIRTASTAAMNGVCAEDGLHLNEGLQRTLRWREMDSNFWYRGTISVDFCGSFIVARPTGSRINDVRSAVRSQSGLSKVGPCLPIGRMRPEALRCVG
jgi:hypothetical protein